MPTCHRHRAGDVYPGTGFRMTRLNGFFARPCERPEADIIPYSPAGYAGGTWPALRVSRLVFSHSWSALLTEHSRLIEPGYSKPLAKTRSSAMLMSSRWMLVEAEAAALFDSKRKV